MMSTRRAFLAGSSAMVLMPRWALANNPATLEAGVTSLKISEEFPNKTELWGYNGSTPGPEIRVKKGEKVKLGFLNSIDQPSAIHWHGIRIDNKMDGVPGLTQELVEPGSSFDYEFVAPDAGTYWYHSHNRSWEQVARGLYGPLIVEEDEPVDVDHDITAILDDWRLDENGALMDGFDNMHDQAHAGRLGNFALAMFPNFTGSLKKGERIRLRMLNAATDRIFPFAVTGLSGKIVALDGMPLDTPMDIETIELAPAQRVDFIGDVEGEELALDYIARGQTIRMGNLKIAGEREGQARGPVSALPPNRKAEIKLADATALTLSMEGGAMSSTRVEGGIWGFNGKAGMDDSPLHSFKRGEHGRIRMENRTAFPHGIHLHGHHFQTVEKLGLGPLRDTILLNPDEVVEVAAVFDNPGKWLLHCHMLQHQAAGMKTWFDVA